MKNKNFVEQVSDKLEKSLKKYVREEIEKVKVEILDKMQEIESRLEKRFENKIKVLKENSERN